jgi:predicted transcriptional regulator
MRAVRPNRLSLPSLEKLRQNLPNYGELLRAGERISTASVESAVDQLLSKRFVKKQQMSWSRRGAHLLLQVRTRVLNEELREKFDEWYPGFNVKSEDQARAT